MKYSNIISDDLYKVVAKLFQPDCAALSFDLMLWLFLENIWEIIKHWKSRGPLFEEVKIVIYLNINHICPHTILSSIKVWYNYTYAKFFSMSSIDKSTSIGKSKLTNVLSSKCASYLLLQHGLLQRCVWWQFDWKVHQVRFVFVFVFVFVFSNFNLYLYNISVWCVWWQLDWKVHQVIFDPFFWVTLLFV